ncbi:MAG TPA: hypothetical protein VKQ36_01395 [Ktedonobacterales bacterium]|nr:hypothetical protein [Ktedonobacterales bacterium]
MYYTSNVEHRRADGRVARFLSACAVGLALALPLVMSGPLVGPTASAATVLARPVSHTVETKVARQDYCPGGYMPCP